MVAAQFLARLEKEIETHEAVHHPFLKKFAAEPLSVKQLQTFGLQHYQLVRIFVNYMTNLLPRIPDPDAGALFRKVFDDEFGRATIFRSHPALYRKFLKALGLQEEEWGKVALLPEVTDYIEEHMEITRESDFRLALGAIGPGHEFSIPIMFSYLVTAFKKDPLLKDEDFEYFTMHIVEDKDHAEIFNQIILRHAGDREGQEKIREGVFRSLEARHRFWSGLERAVFQPVRVSGVW